MLNIGSIIGKFIKNSSQREIDRLKLIVEKINSLETMSRAMPDESFPIRTADLDQKSKKEQD